MQGSLSLILHTLDRSIIFILPDQSLKPHPERNAILVGRSALVSNTKKQGNQEEEGSPAASRKGGIHGSLLALGLAMSTNRGASYPSSPLAFGLAIGTNQRALHLFTKLHALGSAIRVQIKELVHLI